MPAHVATAGQADAALPHVGAGSPVEAGAHLVQVAGCKDCPRAGWLERAGRVRRSAWLTGWSVGFRGPWGTSYRRNLRLAVARMSEDAWVEYLGSVELKPPMPWCNLHRMSERDRRAGARGSQGATRKMRSSPGRGCPRPSRLLEEK